MLFSLRLIDITIVCQNVSACKKVPMLQLEFVMLAGSQHILN